MDIPPKWFSKANWLGLVGRFEDDGVESERVNKPVCVCGVQAPS
jgi:hypothetical protein